MSFVECRVLAIDLRGHGDTVTKNDEDLSIDTLCSMGGAVAVHTAYAQYIPSLIGLAVIDVVEGTALDSLSSMQNVLRCRPKGFKSVEEAIEWCVRSGQEPAHKYEWRINLSKTQDFWNGWFEDLSMHFLECSVPQLLLLAGIDRLDKALTVGQMQGKFQMQVLPHCGHAVHEDVPDKVAEVIATFMVRHKFAEETSNFPRLFPAC
ncbi:unnamed protein product [Darwinula stevensoni]|uniref:protein phosphatase methylesterase-1 n=1 Tax=Darwinula stevensoni TaxID=69355 RepID=A0A7R8XE71_9CRUS|nr:unnamed protein product [Darwinula stevensoni]CAG0893970.1 unnamed protein product [Darwinula stevensoni]